MPNRFFQPVDHRPLWAGVPRAPGALWTLCGLLPFFGVGCAEPFDAERHTLDSFRIAAVGVQGGTAQAVVWSGLGLYHDAPLNLEWTVDDVPIGEGFDVIVPESGRLGLRASSGAEEAWAEVDIVEAPSALIVQREAVRLGSDLRLATRRAKSSAPVEMGVGEDESARIVVDGRSGRTLRWMLAGEPGAILELDADRADLLRNEVRYDSGDLFIGKAGSQGVYSLLVLAIDGEGGNDWAWVDVAMGEVEPVLPHGQRLLSVDAAVPGSGLLLVTAQKSEDGASAGMRWLDPIEATSLAEGEQLACMAPGRAFHLDDLAVGRCTRDELDGARIVLAVP